MKQKSGRYESCSHVMKWIQLLSLLMISNFYYITGRKITQEERNRTSKKKKKAKLFIKKERKTKKMSKYSGWWKYFLQCSAKSRLLETSPFHTVYSMRNPNEILKYIYINPKYLLDFMLHKIELENLKDIHMIKTRLDWKLRNQWVWLSMFWPVS